MWIVPPRRNRLPVDLRPAPVAVRVLRETGERLRGARLGERCRGGECSGDEGEREQATLHRDGDATSAASWALSAIRRRFASSVRPPLSRWRKARTNGVTVAAADSRFLGCGQRPLDQRLGLVEALGGRVRQQEPRAGRAPSAPARPAPPPRRCPRARTPAGLPAPRRRAAARRCEAEHRNAERLQRLGGRRSRRAATSRPTRRRPRACRRARAGRRRRRSAPRWTPPMPPVPRKRMPTARAIARVPPTVVAPTAP